MTVANLRYRLAIDVVATIAAFGLTPFLQKLAIVDGVPARTVALITAVFAAMTAVGVMVVRSPGTPRCLFAPAHRWRLLLLGVLAGGMVTLLAAEALRTTSATNRSLVQSAYPAATLLFAHYLLGERLRVAQYALMVALLIGLLLVNSDAGRLNVDPGFWLLAATLPLVGLGDVYGKSLTHQVSSVVIAGGRSVYGAVFLVIALPLFGVILPSSPAQWAWLCGAGILQGMGIWTLYRAMNVSKASIVAALVASAPLVTVAAEGLFIGISLDTVQWLGLAVVLGAAGWLGYDSGNDRRGGKRR